MVSDAVVAHAVGADLVAAHAASELSPPPGIECLDRGSFAVCGHARFEEHPGRFTVAVLALRRRLGLKAGWQVAHDYAGVRGVAVLAAGALIAGHAHLDLVRVEAGGILINSVYLTLNVMYSHFVRF